MSIEKIDMSERATQLRLEELESPLQYWYLSFAKPRDEGGFQGAVIVKAYGLVTALDRATLLGINPGGEVQGIPVPDPALPADLTDRLLSLADLEAAFGKLVKGSRTGKAICKCCNKAEDQCDH